MVFIRNIACEIRRFRNVYFPYTQASSLSPKKIVFEMPQDLCIACEACASLKAREGDVERSFCIHFIEQFPRAFNSTFSLGRHLEAEFFDEAGKAALKIAHHLAGVVTGCAVRELEALKNNDAFIGVLEDKERGRYTRNARADYGYVGLEVFVERDVFALLIKLKQPRRNVSFHALFSISRFRGRFCG